MTVIPPPEGDDFVYAQVYLAILLSSIALLVNLAAYLVHTGRLP